MPWRPTHTLVVRKLQHEVVRWQKVFLVHPTVVEVVVVHVLGRLAYLFDADTDCAAPPKGTRVAADSRALAASAAARA